ncbi:NADP-dependent oxidoreductase domain-containing protein, partial [Fimicolochytrium jonesii]|uniref:NADP-dependent oxidoreductase domain-containing protein n=1 Tax=Fimicolochytrium jonesii TaxID=1396493 RepID=UPI0022FDC759
MWMLRGRVCRSVLCCVSKNAVYANLTPIVPFRECFSFIPMSPGWRASNVGFGAKEFALSVNGETGDQGIQQSKKGDALTLALRAGVNVIDTSAHFHKGQSEQYVGNVINRQIEEGIVTRESLILVTKAGHHPPVPATSTSPSYPYANLGPNVLAHSLAPAFLEGELTRSLERLGVESVDVFMVNCPERMGADLAKRFTTEKVYDLIGEAFAYLDKEVQRGRITSYGLSSQSLSPSPTATATTLHLPTLLSHLSQSSRTHSPTYPPNLSTVEFPFNILDTATYNRGTYDGAEGVMRHVMRSGLWAVVNRPLLGVSKGARKLVSSPIRGGSGSGEDPSNLDTMTTHLNQLVEMERSLPVLLSMDDSKFLEAFVWGQAIQENITQLLQNPYMGRLYLTSRVAPAVPAACAELKQHGKEAEEWCAEYLAAYTAFASTFLRILDTRQSNDNTNLASLLSSAAKAGAISAGVKGSAPFTPVPNTPTATPSTPSPPPTLQTIALTCARSALALSMPNASTSTPLDEDDEDDEANEPAGTVLVGMHRPEYVRDVLGIVTGDGARGPVPLVSRDVLEDVLECAGQVVV